MKTKILAIALAMLTSCVFENKEITQTSSSAKKASISSSSIQTKAPSRLTMALNKMGLKRVSVDAVDNKIVDRRIDTLPDSTIQETVVITWGEIRKENYNLTYYLFSTGSPVLVDSVTISDSLTYINKEMRGNVITNSLGFTGEGMMPVVMINDSLSVNGIPYARKRFVEHVEDTIDIVVYGTDSSNVHSSVKIRIAYSQNPYFVKQNYILDTNTLSDNTTWWHHKVYVERMNLPDVKWCYAYDITNVIDETSYIEGKFSYQYIGITAGKTTDITKDMLICNFKPNELTDIYINDVNSIIAPIDLKIHDSLFYYRKKVEDSIRAANLAARNKTKVDTIQVYSNIIKKDTTILQDIQMDVIIKDTTL